MGRLSDTTEVKHLDCCQAHNQCSIKVSSAIIITLNQAHSQSFSQKALKQSQQASPLTAVSGTVFSLAPQSMLSTLRYHNTAPRHVVPCGLTRGEGGGPGQGERANMAGGSHHPGESWRPPEHGQGLWAWAEESMASAPRPGVLGLGHAHPSRNSPDYLVEECGLRPPRVLFFLSQSGRDE